MKIGAMNNPEKDLYSEIKFIKKSRFKFLDLTLEYPKSYADDLDIPKLKKAIGKMPVIGHTPWNLPIASPFKGVRRAAFGEFSKCVDVFHKLGVKKVNIHPAIPKDLADPELILEYNIKFLRKAVRITKEKNMIVMMENTQSIFNDLNVIASMLHKVKGLQLHWDVGHANLGNEGEQKTKLAFLNLKDRIEHLHFSDNNGSDDQHLPLGAGNINWILIMSILKEYKYKGTITLEIHTPDLSYLLFSREKILMLEDEL